MRLQLCCQDDFIVVFTDKTSWMRMGSEWSQEATPGEWIRSPEIIYENQCSSKTVNSPEGIIVAALALMQLEPGDKQRFLVLWFQ